MRLELSHFKDEAKGVETIGAGDGRQVPRHVRNVAGGGALVAKGLVVISSGLRLAQYRPAARPGCPDNKYNLYVGLQ